MEFFLAMGLALLCALIGGRIACIFKIPSVTGYLLTGIVLGPSATGILTHDFVSHAKFINELALGIIAFYIGMEFEAKHLRRLKKTITFLSLGDIIVTSGIVFIGLKAICTISISLTALFAVLSVATAPAATLLVIRELDSEGPLTEHLKALVGLNNLFCILAFIIILNMISYYSGSHPVSLLVLSTLVAKELGVPLLLGSAISLFYHYYLRRGVEGNQLLLVSLSGIMLGVGLSSYYSVSPLLTNLVAGAILVNICDRSKQIPAKLSEMDYPLYVLFFALAGAGLHFEKLGQMGMVGIIYIAARAAGKIIGPHLSSMWIKNKNFVGRYIGMGLLPQAGLAIGLASWTTREMPELGSPLISTILATTVFFEIAGPVLTKICLVKAGEVKIVKLLVPGTFGQLKNDICLLMDRFKEAVGKRPSYVEANLGSENILVKHLMRHHIDTIPEDAPLDRIVKIMEWSRYNILPVIGKGKRWVGMISLTHLRDLFLEQDLARLIIARDVAIPMQSVSPEDGLEYAMKIFETNSVPYLPVVDKTEGGVFQGVIHRRDVCLYFIEAQGKAEYKDKKS